MKAVENKKLQRWISELLKLPYGLLMSTDQYSIDHVQINNPAQEPRCVWADEERTQFILPFPPSSTVLFF